jgi:ATP-dependent helicase IRC3
MSTGLGKTVAFAALLRHPAMREWLETFPEGQRKMLVIAHREELLDQSADKIQRANPGILVSIEQGDRVANRYSDVIIASIQTLQASKFKRLKALLRTCKFRIVIIDEAHHAAAPTYRTALVHLGFLPPADASDSEEIEAANETDAAEMAKNLAAWDERAPKDQLLVGVTATPNRSDAIGLGAVFQSLCYSYGLKAAIDDQWLVPIVPWVVETKSTLDDVGTNRGDFNQRELADAVNNAHRNALAVEAWTTYAGDQSTLAFTVDVAHAHALAEAFQVVGIEARAVSGKTDKEERRQILADYTAGRVRVICNCMIFTEGTDLPRTGCILHAKPTKSTTLYTQMTGRGLRLYPGKKECVVIDLVDIAKRHSLQTAPVLYGLPPGIKANGKDLATLENELEAFLRAHPGFNIDGAGRKTMEELNAWASTFDVWDVPELGAFGAGRALNWIKSGLDEYRLEYPWLDGFELLKVARDLLDRFSVSLTFRPKGGGSVRQRTIAMEIESADAAAGLAEAFVLQERRAVMKLKSADAPWRLRPASEKQIGLLARLRVAIKPGLTAGAASDLIDIAQSRRKR